MSKKQQRQPGVLYCAASFVLSLVLMHGLVASPLLVVCMPGDGRTLTELIGQDPCHHLFGEIGSSSAQGFSLGSDDPADPCVDLILDNFGVTQSAMDLVSPLTLVTGQQADAPPVIMDDTCVPIVVTTFKLAREPVLAADRDPRLTSSLRI